MFRSALKSCVPALAALSLAAGQEALAGTIDTGSITSGGVSRTYTFYEPDSLGASAHPLLIALHGSGGSGNGMMDSITEYVFNTNAEADKWIVVYPDGIEVDGKGRWNDCRITEENPTTDDVLFVSDLIDHFEGLYNIDPRRIYVAGHSNGSMLTHRIGIELSDRVAAIAGTTGSLAADGEGNTECGGAVHAMPVLYEAATTDPVIPYAGGSVGDSDLRSQEDTVAFWVAANGANPTPTVESVDDGGAEDHTTLTKYTYSGGSEGTEVIYYKAEPSDGEEAEDFPGHAWPSPTQFGALKRSQLGWKPQDIEFAELAWDFFSSHTLGSPLDPVYAEDFEDGDLAGWTTSGSVSNIASQHYEGSRGGQLQQTSSLTTSIVLGPQTSVDLSFAYKTAGLDSGEKLKAEYRLDGGGWSTLGQAAPTGWQTASFPIDVTDADVLEIRFSLNANLTSEYAYIDAIELD